MKNSMEKIDQYCRERFGQFEQQPPEAAWDRIAAKLGHTRKKRKVLLIFRIAAGMALVFSLGIGYYLTTRPDGHAAKSPLSDRPHTTSTPGTGISAAETAGPADTHVPRDPVSNHLINTFTVPKEDAPVPADEPAPDKPVYASRLLPVTPRHDQRLLPAEAPHILPLARPAAVRYLTPEEAAEMLLAAIDPPAEKPGPDPDRWTLGSEFAPLYSYRTIASDYLASEMVNTLNEAESGLLSFAGGIRVAFSTGRRLSVQSGLYYSRYGQEKNKVETYSYNNTEYTSNGNAQATFLAVSNSTGVILSNQPGNAGFDRMYYGAASPAIETSDFTGQNNFSSTEQMATRETNITVEQRFDYLEIPLLVKYKIIDRKFDFSLTGGLVTNLLVGNTVNLEQQGEKIRFGKTDDISLVNYLGSLGLGFEYPIASGFAFSIEPRVRYYLNPIDKSSQINVHPYSFGIFAGINYVF